LTIFSIPDAVILTPIAVLESNHGLTPGCHCWLVQQCDSIPEELSRITIIYQKDKERVPVKDWLAKVRHDDPDGARRCLVRIGDLKDHGFDLHKSFPKKAEFLRDDVYYLRIKKGSIRYRIFYFFHGEQGVILHGFKKKQKKAPENEIEKAVEEKTQYESNPKGHGWEGEL